MISSSDQGQPQGRITSVRGSLVAAEFSGAVRQNEVAYVQAGDSRLKSEVIRIQGDRAELQVFEETRGIRVGDPVIFTGELLTAQLGPGLLGQVFDGLQNPLWPLAREHGFFLPRGVSLDALDKGKEWEFDPAVREGDAVRAGHFLGHVKEGIFRHRIMVPFHLRGSYRIAHVAEAGTYTIDHTIATIEGQGGETIPLSMHFTWPVKVPIRAYEERLRPTDPMVTGIRIIDTFLPVAKGGTYCIPGPFGAGKTVLQQITARHAEVDVVVIAACGERAGEVVETLRVFPTLEDPKTGRSLMERTIIVCNTSSMPVAAREASVYTALTMAEYYRQMGLHVLLLADSTSRWAQAMREISGRLEEIPGEEAYPAYLESRIARFYERAGLVRLYNGQLGSVTIGGTVSPAGGNLEEPVTQGTLKVVGAFHALSRDRANARRFPSIDPNESWSRYRSFIPSDQVEYAKGILRRGNEVLQMMKVLGEEGTSLEDLVVHLKAELLDHVYLQQNAFDEVDGFTSSQRQDYVFRKVVEFLRLPLRFGDRDEARQFFHVLRQAFVDWNYSPWGSARFEETEGRIHELLQEKAGHEEGI